MMSAVLVIMFMLLNSVSLIADDSAGAAAAESRSVRNSVRNSAPANRTQASGSSGNSGSGSGWSRTSRGWSSTAKDRAKDQSKEQRPQSILFIAANPSEQIAGTHNAAEHGRLADVPNAVTTKPSPPHASAVTSAPQHQESGTHDRRSKSSASEKLKRTIIDQGKIDDAQSRVTDTPPLPDSKKPESSSPPAVSPGHSELDGLQQEKARRFAELKEQILRLRSQVRRPAHGNHSSSSDPHAAPSHSAASEAPNEPSGAENHAAAVDADASHSEVHPPDSASGHGHEALQADHSAAAEPLNPQSSATASDSATKHPTHHATDAHANVHAGDGHTPDDSDSDARHSTEHHASGADHGGEHGGEHGEQHAAESAAGETNYNGDSEHPGSLAGSQSSRNIVDGPIDRVGLANNLYAVGEYLLALEMYQQADPSELSAQEQMWAEYQIANCLRRTGKRAEASNRYRRLAGQPEAGWLSSQSQWWVDVLEQIRQLEEALQEMPDAAEPLPESPLQLPGKQAPSGVSGTKGDHSHEQAH